MAADSYKLRSPKGGLRRQIEFMASYFQINLLISLEYRVAFFSKVFGMLINDIIWLFFWWVFFTRFPGVSDYGVKEALMLWVISALAIGWSLAIFGNAIKLANIIATGGLDYYLAVPKNVLLHVMISRMDIEAWGDLIFALGAFELLYHPDLQTLALVLVLGFLAGVVLVSFNIIVQCLAFVMGNSESLANQLMFAMITFTTYPSHLFRGIVKAFLYTVIPAAFVSYIPVELIREFHWELFGLLVGAAILILGLAIGVFYAGLRRYESGNLIQMRS